jgi:tRNA(fMet)-specific endonuclease VapC
VIVEGYLLDTNAVAHWYQQQPKLAAHVNALDKEAQVRVSVITLGELEFGHNVSLQDRDQERRDAFAKWVDKTFPHPRTVDVTRHTRDCYGKVRAAIFDKYPPLGSTENHPERCYDRVAASELGFDENDLWIVAQAIEHGLILITQDNMQRIKELAQSACDFPLQYQDWTV